MASMGERSAAFLAGNTPKIMPTPEDTPSAMTTVIKSIYTGKKLRNMSTTANAIRRPSAPPRAERRMDSARN